MSREHAHAYEAGYRDGSINYELEHCPACKNVADLQEALAENAKLRELIYDFIVDEERGHNDDVTFREHVIRAHEYVIAQGIEVDE